MAQKQDNGNHFTTPLYGANLIERDRLRALNAELITALHAVVATGGLDGANLTNSLVQARAVLVKARP